MIAEIQNLLDRYLIWLKDNTSLREIEDSVEITTPYLDRHNDFIQIYAKKQNGGYLLTDDAYTIEDLKMSGCKIETPKRVELLKMTLNGFGISLSENEALEVKTTKDRFALHKHNLLQAILAVNDLFYLAEPFVKVLFMEDVIAWLDSIDVRYTSNVKFTGKSGYDHTFDFVIPKSKKYPERILKTINNPNKDTAKAIAFSWIDTREVRPSNSKAYALLNDQEKDVPSNVIDALRSYEVHPILWTQREKARAELVA
jgi:hypothetical protein